MPTAQNELRSITELLPIPAQLTKNKCAIAARVQLEQLSGGGFQWSEPAVWDKTPVTKGAEEFISAGKAVKWQTFLWWAGKVVAIVTRVIWDKI